MKQRLRIAVVGCGIAGTSTALLARRAGHEVELFERSDRVGPIGAGVLLQPSGQRVLGRMGLLDAVTMSAEVITEIHAVTHRGRNLIRLEYGEGRPGGRAFGLHRGDLFSVLHAALCREGVQLHLGIEIQRCESQADQAFLRDGMDHRFGPFDLVVAADGARSRLRERCAIEHGSHAYGYGALWAVGQNVSMRGRLFQVTRGTRRLCGLLPMGKGRCSFFWGLRLDEARALQSPRAWDAFRAEVAGLAPAANEVLDQIRSIDQLVFTTFRHTIMRSWSQGRLIFIGDAAHATSPHLGQGINLALVDAWALNAALQQSSTVAEALCEYEASRRAQLRYYSMLTGWLTPFFQSDGWVLGMGRDVVLPLVSRLGPVRQFMLATLHGEALLHRRQTRRHVPTFDQEVGEVASHSTERSTIAEM